MDKWRLPFDSAHQIDVEIPFHGVLIVVARCTKGGGKVAGAILEIGNLRMFLPVKQQPENLWTNGYHSSILRVRKVRNTLPRDLSPPCTFYLSLHSVPPLRTVTLYFHFIFSLCSNIQSLNLKLMIVN